MALLSFIPITMNRLLLRSAPPKSAASPVCLHRAALFSSIAPRFPTRRHSSTAAAPSASDGEKGAAAEIRVGTIKSFDYKKGFGFVVPDGVDQDHHDAAEIAFIHSSQILQHETPEADGFHPVLRKGMRVQFKVGAPAKGTKSMMASGLTLEGGDLVPPFHANFLEKHAARQKAAFGQTVFNAYSQLHRKDQEELERRIVTAFDEVRQTIADKREVVKRIEALYAREPRGAAAGDGTSGKAG